MAIGTMSGADPDLLAALGQQLNESADQLRALQARVNAQVQSIPWAGRHADGFRADWASRHGPAVVAAASGLEAAAAAATANADDQRLASATGSGTATGPGGTHVAGTASATTGAVPARARGAAAATSAFGDVATGIGAGLADIGGGVINGLASFGNAALHHPEDLAALAAGVGLTVLGAGGEIGGVALDVTGVGAVAGIPLNVASAGAIVAGVSITGAALADLTMHAVTDDGVQPASTGQSASGGGEGALENVNAAGEPYPQVTDPRTGEPISAPLAGLSKVPAAERVPWDAQQRGAFIKEWYDQGYETPEGGWPEYDIHHITPREYGGTNDFDNLVPVRRTVHQQEFNSWWAHYGN